MNAILQRNVTPFILPRDIQVCVVSFGGVGTSFLMTHLARFVRLNDPHARDGIKHVPIPPLAAGPRVRFVYVYGDPVAATVSLFRRGLHHAHSVQLQRWTSPQRPIPDEWTLDQYVRVGDDLLRFGRHFENWYDRYLSYPTMFVRYETIFSSLSSIAEFLGLPGAFSREFPSMRKRRSALEDLPVQTQQGLQDMYGSIQDRLDRVPDVEMRVPSRPISTVAKWRSRPGRYRRALVVALCRAVAPKRLRRVIRSAVTRFRS